MWALAVLVALVGCPPAFLAPPQLHVTHSAVRFLQRFGYIWEGAPGLEAQYTEEALREALLTMQLYGGINQTGLLDQDTLKLMTRRRCGVKDVQRSSRSKRYAVVGTGWRKREITYMIANWSPLLGEELVSVEVARALELWAGYGQLTFIRRTRPPADIVIDFRVGHHGDQFPFDGPGNILAHAFFPHSSPTHSGHVHFDNDEAWSSGEVSDDSASTDFFSVAVHELGHALGLGHSSVPSSLMFPYYRPPSPSTQLDYDDVMAMYQLYIGTQIDDNVGHSHVEGAESHPEWEEPNPKGEEQHPKGEESNLEGGESNPKGEEPHTTSNPLSICGGEYDAVAVLRGELFVFRGRMVWRFTSRGHLQPEYPIALERQFPLLPPHLPRVDALFEKSDGSIAIFSGPQHWVYREGGLEGPLPLTSYGLPPSLDHVNAAFVWSKNQMTYLFHGRDFWRFNESTGRLDGGYPMEIEVRWRRIPRDVDAAISWTDGSAYFFKGHLFWRFSSSLMSGGRHYPLPATPYWFGCPETLEAFRELPPEILTLGYMP